MKPSHLRGDSSELAEYIAHKQYGDDSIRTAQIVRYFWTNRGSNEQFENEYASYSHTTFQVKTALGRGMVHSFGAFGFGDRVERAPNRPSAETGNVAVGEHLKTGV